MKLNKVITADPVMSRVQFNTEQALNDLERRVSLPFGSGVYLDGISLVGGDNAIAHNLGRSASGYFLTKKTTSVDVYYSASQPTDINKLSLTSTGASVISLYIF